MYETFHYQTEDGVDVFDTWLDEVADARAVARLIARIDRVQAGNFGDHKPVDLPLEGLQRKAAEIMKKEISARSVSHDLKVMERLRTDARFASEYLKAAMDDQDEPRVLLIALRRIAEARGGITQIARKAGIERESLHRALSGRGNPRFSTLSAIAKAVGLRVTVEPA